MEKKYKGAPFGIQTARFDINGVHPKHRVPGGLTEDAYCQSAISVELGPGKYDIDRGAFSARILTEKASGPGWARAYEVHRQAALPHLLNKEQWELKQLQRQKLGPGMYDIKDWMELDNEKPRSCRGIIESKEPRFREPIAFTVPGPGTYGKHGVPHTLMEERSRTSYGTVGLLECGGNGSRTLPFVGSRLGPGTYTFPSSVEQLAHKVVSLRGPYDLFTADRNKPIIVGHYARMKTTNLGPGEYDCKTTLDELKSVQKKRVGKFSTTEQYPKVPSERIFFTLNNRMRDPNDPGPGHYESTDPNQRPLTQAKTSPPFLSSAPRVDKAYNKFFTGNYNSVGAGRYDIQKFEDAQDVNGHHSNFKSKTRRPSVSKFKFMQERIRGMNVPLDQRLVLVPSDTSRVMPHHDNIVACEC